MRRWTWLLVGGMAIAARAAEPTLDECLRTAVAENPSALAAVERIRAADALLQQSAAAYYPRVTMSAGYTRTDNPPQAFMMRLNQRTLDMRAPDFDPNQPGDTGNMRLSAGARWMLLDFGRRSAGYEAARHGRDAQAAQAAAVRNTLVHEVTRSYYATLQAQAFAAVQRETAGSLDENLRIARERLAAGATVKTDVLNLEVQLAQAREDDLSASNAVRLAVAALNTVIGRDCVDEAGLSAPAEQKLPPPPAPAGGAEHRPERRAAAAAAAARESALRLARSEQMPTVSAFGSYDWDGTSTAGLENSYLAGVGAEWELFTGFQRREAVRQAEAEARAARLDEQQARNQIRLDVRQAEIRARTAWERLGVARKSAQSAEEALRITREQYRQGAADLATLLTSQVGLTATRTRIAAAYYDYLIALSNIRRARGELAELGLPPSPPGEAAP